MSAISDTFRKIIERHPDRIVHWRTVRGPQGTHCEIPENLNIKIKEYLRSKKILSLYSHQHQALNILAEGKNLLLGTDTGSGKTLIYNIFSWNRLLARPGRTALYIFPTKALAQNQAKILEEFPLTAEIYDGDTTGQERRRIKSRPPHILITNPDMLHFGILPHHERWASFLKGLTCVVVDEAHTYRGIFGSHVAHVLRRLRRLCEFYGSSPQFILSSATARNGKEFASQLTGLCFEEVNSTGSPGSKKHFIFWDCGENSPYGEALSLAREIIGNGLKTIIFTQSRRSTELLTLWLSQKMADEAKISPYRAGYLAEVRRSIEAELFSGELDGIISTSALELGIDVGALDCCILFGFPGSIMSTRQRIGRVGRSGKDGLVVYIPLENQMDKFFLNHPDEFFDREPESLVVNPENEIIAEQQIRCACAELPLSEADAAIYGQSFREVIKKPGFYLCADGARYSLLAPPPHGDMNLRGIGRQWRIIDRVTGVELGMMDETRVFTDCHPGAVYLHRMRKYQVTSLNMEKTEIAVEEFHGDYFTVANWREEIYLLEKCRQYPQGSVQIGEGPVRVTMQVTGYERKRESDRSLISTEFVSLPEQTYQTQAIFIAIPEVLSERIRKRFDFPGTLHAVEHLIIGVMPLEVFCDRWDIGGYSFVFHPQTETATIFIYDGYPGGAGIVKTCFPQMVDIFKLACETVSLCKCENGCPSCIQSPKCGNGNKPLDKRGAEFLLRTMLE